MSDRVYIEPRSSERKYRRLAELGRILGVPVPQVWLEIEVTMPDGRVLHHHRQRSHTWVRNAYNVLYSQLACADLNDASFGAGYLSIKMQTAAIKHFNFGYTWCPAYEKNTATSQDYDIAGASVSLYGYGGPANTATGIVVGSGINAESFEDYAMQTLISSGSGASQLSYAISDIPSNSYNAGTKTMTRTRVRYFNNNTSGNIDVNEVGILAGLMPDTSTGITYFLVTRDHLSSTVTVPSTGQLKVTYTWALTYPA